MATFGATFLDTINKSKAHDCKRNLSPTILRFVKIPKIISLPILVFKTETLLTQYFAGVRSKQDSYEKMALKLILITSLIHEVPMGKNASENMKDHVFELRRKK